MLKINVELFVSYYVRDLISGGKYELLICDLMNKSTVVFPKKYKHNDLQNDGQSDFESIDGKDFFDIKLFLDKPRGKDLCSKTRNIIDYSTWMSEVVNQLYNCVKNQEISDIKNTIAYKIMSDKIKSIKENENFIAFFTFPMAGSISTSLLNDLPDLLTILTEPLREVLESRKLYYILPTLDGKIELRDAIRDKREFFECNKFNEFFRASIE